MMSEGGARRRSSGCCFVVLARDLNKFSSTSGLAFNRASAI